LDRENIDSTIQQPEGEPQPSRRRFDRRTMLKAGLTAVVGVTAGGWRGQDHETERRRANSDGALGATLSSDKIRYQILVAYQIPPAGGPFYIEILATSTEPFRRLEPITGPQGLLELPVGLWEIPDGREYVLTVVDGQREPLDRIESAFVAVPSYPQLGTNRSEEVTDGN